VVARAGEAEEVLYAEVDLEAVEAVRGMVPISGQRRTDLYTVLDKEREAKPR
jgi:predicted amidohydrolase